MFEFSFGLMPILLAVALPLIYVVTRQARRAIAWVGNNEPPKERAWVIVLITALFGLIVGSFIQPVYEQALVCNADTQPLVQCVLTNL